MATPATLDHDRTTPAAGRGALHFCTLLEQADQPDQPAVGTWSVRDVGAHLALGVPAYTQMLQGVPSPARTLDGIAAWNHANVARLAGADCAALAARIHHAYTGYLAEARRHAADQLVAWHADIKLPVTTLTAILAGEAYIHGWDLARALGKPWQPPPEDLRTTFLGLLPVLPHYLDPTRAAGFTAAFDVRLRGDAGGDAAARAIFRFDRGRLTIQPPGRQPPEGQRVDCRIVADPAAYLLVTYGRLGPLRPALTGKITATGRKPWLGLRLPHLFRTP